MRLSRLLGVWLAMLVAGAGVLVFSSPASAAAGERIDSFRVVLAAQSNGDLQVTEKIDYNFGSNYRHGLVRVIPVQFRLNKNENRIYRLENIDTEADGGYVAHHDETQNGELTMKLGDPDRTITGSHAYTLRYTVKGAFNSFSHHEELYWNAIGDKWQVPISDVSVEVTGPANITQVACFAGPTGSHLRCDSESEAGTRSATFSQRQLAAYSAMSVVVGFPKGSIKDSGPILEQRHDLAAAFQLTPWSIGGAIGLTGLGVALALFVLWRIGRDRVYAGQIPGLTPMPGEDGRESRKRLFGRRPIAVEFTPPDKIKPAQAGTLIDERADTIDVTATIIDFAVRKLLHIKEIPRKGRFSKQDWELTALVEDDPNFSEYESGLFHALFKSQTTVRLSGLKNHFAADLTRVKRSLYRDVVSNGWYRASPESTRGRYQGWGIAALVVAAIATAGLAKFTHVALIGVGAIIAAVVLLCLAGFMPARTGKGSAMLARILGFRQYLATAEADQIRFEEREEIFSRYLPYAIVFGVAEHWASIFSDLSAVQPDGTSGLYWYAGLQGWSLAYFSGSIGSFSTSTGGVISSSPASSSGGVGGSSGFGGGGFSGGGGGGGGGGSW